MSRLAARENMLGHSTDIANDMLTGGVSECNITCLIFQDEVDEIGGLDALWNLAKSDTAAAPVHFHTITGDHTGRGAGIALEKKPNRADLKRMKVTILLCDKNDPDTYTYALAYGIQDNEQADSHVSHNVWDIVLIMHNFITETKLLYPDNINGKPHEEFQKALKAKRSKLLKDFKNTAPNTQGSLWVIAQKSEPVWALIKQIKIGDEASYGSKDRSEKQSHGHFTNMSDIPDETLIGWLTTVARGQQKTKWFNEQCIYYKKVVWVKKAIVEHVNIMHTSEQFLNFDTLVERFPGFAVDKQFNNWVYTCGSVAKQGLPATIKKAVDICLQHCLTFEVTDTYTTTKIYTHTYAHTRTHTHTDTHTHTYTHTHTHTHTRTHTHTLSDTYTHTPAYTLPPHTHTQYHTSTY
jgi:hypothetical protein